MKPIYLKKFRQKTGLNQKEFAQSVGMTQQAISYYETGKRELTLEKFRQIKACFGFVENHDTDRLRVMIDYLRITFKSVVDLEAFVSQVLQVDLKEFSPILSSLMNYQRVWKRGDIWMFDYLDKHDTGNYQITLQISGQGCRQLELIFEQKGLTWFEFLQSLAFRYPDMNVTRLDLAIDELYLGHEREDEQFHLPEMIAKYYKQELRFEALRTWNYIGGGALKFSDVDEL